MSDPPFLIKSRDAFGQRARGPISTCRSWSRPELRDYGGVDLKSAVHVLRGESNRSSVCFSGRTLPPDAGEERVQRYRQSADKRMPDSNSAADHAAGCERNSARRAGSCRSRQRSRNHDQIIAVVIESTGRESARRWAATRPYSERPEPPSTTSRQRRRPAPPVSEGRAEQK